MLEDRLRIMLLLAAMLAASPALAKPVTPADLEMETWRAFQAKRVGEIKSLFAPNFVGVYADGTHDLARELQSLNRVTIQDYKISDLKSLRVNGDAVMLTYVADARLVVDAKPVSRKMWVASLWSRERGRWLCVYHTEIAAK
jgi:hypothetical protein